MKQSFQIWLRAALALLLAFAGLFGETVHTARAYALISAARLGSTITYDNEGNVAYDGSYRSPFAYDGGATPPENKYGHQLSRYRPPFGIFSDFLAAKGVEQGRDALGRFLPKAGGEVPGSLAEQAVWDAVKQKPGWSVIEGRVSVRNAAGDLRIYDGAAVSPRGRVIGLEVKSGGATRTGSQSAFDAGVDTFNPAVGVGENAGLEVGRSLLIRRP